MPRLRRRRLGGVVVGAREALTDIPEKLATVGFLLGPVRGSAARAALGAARRRLRRPRGDGAVADARAGLLRRVFRRERFTRRRQRPGRALLDARRAAGCRPRRAGRGRGAAAVPARLSPHGSPRPRSPRRGSRLRRCLVAQIRPQRVLSLDGREGWSRRGGDPAPGQQVLVRLGRRRQRRRPARASVGS